TPRLLVRFGVVESVDARVADVAGEESPRLARDLLGDAERHPVDLLEIALAPDDLELGSMRVVGERLHDVRAGVNELAVQRLHQRGPLEHDLWNVRARLEIPPSLELEQIPFGADDGSVRQPFEQSRRLLRGRFRGRDPLRLRCHDWSANSLPKM